MGKKSGSGSGMKKKPDHISKSLETIFWVKILTFLCRSGIRNGKNSDPGSKMEKTPILDPRWKKF
jgi:hypothetical protein